MYNPDLKVRTYSPYMQPASHQPVACYYLVSPSELKNDDSMGLQRGGYAEQRQEYCG
jgi:hypothetical protein